jgi:hypothetical protein
VACGVCRQTSTSMSPKGESSTAITGLHWAGNIPSFGEEMPSCLPCYPPRSHDTQIEQTRSLLTPTACPFRLRTLLIQSPRSTDWRADIYSLIYRGEVLYSCANHVQSYGGLSHSVAPPYSQGEKETENLGSWRGCSRFAASEERGAKL